MRDGPDGNAERAKWAKPLQLFPHFPSPFDFCTLILRLLRSMYVQITRSIADRTCSLTTCLARMGHIDPAECERHDPR